MAYPAPEKPIGQVRVADVMTVDPVTLRPSDSVDAARDLMLATGIHGIPIVDGRGTTLGIVTSHDLVDDWNGHEALVEVMTEGPTTIDEEATVVEAAELMKTEFIHHLLVTGADHLTGIISTFDLLDVLLEAAPPSNPVDRRNPDRP